MTQCLCSIYIVPKHQMDHVQFILIQTFGKFRNWEDIGDPMGTLYVCNVFLLQGWSHFFTQHTCETFNNVVQIHLGPFYFGNYHSPLSFCIETGSSNIPSKFQHEKGVAETQIEPFSHTLYMWNSAWSTKGSNWLIFQSRVNIGLLHAVWSKYLSSKLTKFNMCQAFQTHK